LTAIQLYLVDEELDKKALTAIQLYLADEVLVEFSTEKTTSLLWERLQDYYMKKSLANRLILKQRLFLLRIHEGTPIKSHIIKFSFIINDLDKKDVKIEDEDQALLLLCLYLLHIRALRKSSSMEASQQLRSMRSRSI